MSIYRALPSLAAAGCFVALMVAGFSVGEAFGLTAGLGVMGWLTLGDGS